MDKDYTYNLFIKVLNKTIIAILQRNVNIFSNLDH